MKSNLFATITVTFIMTFVWNLCSCSSHSGCKKDDECQNDTYCNKGKCIPYGTGPRGDHNPDCTTFVVVGLIQPALKCEWTGPPADDPYPDNVEVLSSPMVADFDFDSNPDTIQPSIVFNTYDNYDQQNGDSGNATPNSGVLRVIDGSTCILQYTVASGLLASDSVAIGDLDGDGRPEIVAHTKDLTLNAYKYNPATNQWERIWQGHDSNGNIMTFDVIAHQAWGGPSIIDLNNDGRPEILSGGAVYDADGLLLDESIGFYGVYFGGSPVATDLYSDNSVELLNGNGIWKFANNKWTSQTPYPKKSDGYTAVADFGTYGDDPAKDDRTKLDGIPEIVVVADGAARIDTLNGRTVFGPVALPNNSEGGGPPAIGDIDGDGRAEIVAAGSNSITVFDPDCNSSPDTAYCNSQRTDGILWTQISQDYSSNKTGVSLFDFDSDGAAEVIYADEVFLRIYRGIDGNVLFSQWHSSCTWNEYPVVADVDGDSSAELVIPSNQNCGTVPGDHVNPSAYPSSHNGKPMDPLFAGLPCKSSADCKSGNCDQGLCRCTADSDCGDSGEGFVCDSPPLGTPGTGTTCRAEWLGDINGIRVYHDRLNRWPGSRHIWNQYSYSITNVGDNGAIPKTSDALQNWKQQGLNNFRENAQGDRKTEYAPDLTSAHGSFDCSNATMTLYVNVCNRGMKTVAAGLKVGFFSNYPKDPTNVCNPEATTTNDLGIGACETVVCTWPSAPNNPGDITVIPDYDNQVTECAAGNNQGVIKKPHC